MDDLNEIEAAIKKLSQTQFERLAAWMQAFRTRRQTPSHVEAWLKRAVGAAIPGVTTDDVLKMTRGEE